MVAENGFVSAFYSGFVPILFKQIPYTMAKFAVQGAASEVNIATVFSSECHMVRLSFQTLILV